MVKSSLIQVINQAKTLLSQKDHAVLAIDGKSGAGKSTFSQKLAQNLSVIVVNCDDFYSGPPKKGDELSWNSLSVQKKYNQVIDYKKIKKQVLKPLLKNKTAAYYPFNFKKGYGLSSKKIILKPQPVIILDGIYSARPELSSLVDLSVLVTYPEKPRRQRLLKREGKKFMSQWHQIWDKVEDYYFTKIKPKKSFDFIV